MGSLHFLIPDQEAASDHSSTVASTSSTARYLEELTARLTDHVANREWTHPDWRDYLIPEYTAYLEYSEHPITKTRKAYLENSKAFVDAHPTYILQRVAISAEVNENNGTAVVWQLLKVKGHPANVERESVTLVYWRRQAGKWRAYKQTGIRGIDWYPQGDEHPAPNSSDKH